MTIKYFNVKGGKNRGFYIAIEGMNKNEAVKELQKNDIYLGIVNKEYNEGFYKYHNIKDGYIFTLNGYTSYEYNEKMFEEYLNILKNNYKIEKIK